MPLIMTHGWPGSVVELLETVGPLTDPTAHGGDAEDAFHLVLPSMPGYGFSQEPKELGWNAVRIATAWAELMKRLGYDRYVAQGGDVGAAVTDLMGRQALEGLVERPHQPARGGDRHRRPAAGGNRTGTRRTRSAQGRSRRAASAISWRWPRDRRRSATRCSTHPSPGGVDARPRHRQLLQDRRRLRRRPAHGQSHPGPHRRQRHAVLADGDRRLSGPQLLGGPAGTGCRGKPAPAAGVGAGRLHHVPRRDLGQPRAAGPRRPSPASPTSTRPSGVATLPPGRSPSSSPPSSERRSGGFAR